MARGLIRAHKHCCLELLSPQYFWLRWNIDSGRWKYCLRICETAHRSTSTSLHKTFPLHLFWEHSQTPSQDLWWGRRASQPSRHGGTQFIKYFLIPLHRPQKLEEKKKSRRNEKNPKPGQPRRTADPSWYDILFTLDFLPFFILFLPSLYTVWQCKKCGKKRRNLAHCCNDGSYHMYITWRHVSFVK